MLIYFCFCSHVYVVPRLLCDGFVYHLGKLTLVVHPRLICNVLLIAMKMFYTREREREREREKKKKLRATERSGEKSSVCVRSLRFLLAPSIYVTLLIGLHISRGVSWCYFLDNCVFLSPPARPHAATQVSMSAVRPPFSSAGYASACQRDLPGRSTPTSPSHPAYE